MGKRKTLTARDIEKARELVRRFGDANLSYLPRASQEELVSIYYNTINRVPLREVSENQLYMIVERIYHQAHEIVQEANEGTLEGRFV